MVSENYACAYKEVIEVLKHTKREDVNKIPKLEIILWRQNMKKDYNFKIDENKPIEDQNLSKEAKAVLANIFKKYWATDYQRERIEAKEKYDLEQIEKEKYEKYNPDNIFKNRNKVRDRQLLPGREKTGAERKKNGPTGCQMNGNVLYW